MSRIKFEKAECASAVLSSRERTVVYNESINRNRVTPTDTLVTRYHTEPSRFSTRFCDHKQLESYSLLTSEQYSGRVGMQHSSNLSPDHERVAENLAGLIS